MPTMTIELASEANAIIDGHKDWIERRLDEGEAAIRRGESRPYGPGEFQALPRAMIDSRIGS